MWLSRANHTYRVALLATHLAVHFLTADDHDVAAAFGGETGDEIDKFAGVAWTPGPAGVPLLDRCPHRMVVRRVTLVDDGGDHVGGRHRAGRGDHGGTLHTAAPVCRVRHRRRPSR